MNRLALLLAVACGACRSAPAVTNSERAPKVRLQAPLTFEAAGSKVLPVPLAEVSVGGQVTRLIVDTGASDHVFTRAFVATSKLVVRGTAERGTDHAGAGFEATPLARTQVTLGGVSVSVDAFAVEGPPPFEPLGLGGFLSPQRLFETGYVVLDFPGRTLVALDTDADGVRAWLERGGPVQALTTKWVNHKPFTELSLAGRPPVFGEVDTGGSTSELSFAYAGATADAGGCQGIGVSGHCIEGSTLEDQRVRFAGHEFAGLTLGLRPVIAHGPGLANEQALVGMDVLRRCVLAVPNDQASPVLARCTP